MLLLVGWLQQQQQQQEKHALFANSAKAGNLNTIFLFSWECVQKKKLPIS
jgi:hypothetical protein